MTLFQKKTLTVVGSLAVFILAAGIIGTTAWAQQPNKIPVLIGFNRQPGPAEEALVRRAGGSIKYTYHLVPAIAATLPENTLDALRRNPNIVTIEPDGLFHKIDFASELGDTWGVNRIGGGAVHVNGNTGYNVKVAIIDSGIDYTHADLGGCFGPGCKVEGGHDFVNNDPDPIDDDGHGTHVAGTVAANWDGLGVVGVAPNAKLYALKVLNASGSGSFSDVIAALQWVVDQRLYYDNQIAITNNSYGSSGDPGTLVKAAFDNSYAAGVLHVAAAGNSGNCKGKNDSVGYPAKYASVIAVAATNSSDARACWSSTGSAVELSAPGVSINSTKMGGGYVAYSGTSMASPHVAGVAALVLGAGPIADTNGNGRVNDDVRQILISTADDLGDAGKDNLYGYGLVNAFAAVAAVGSPGSPSTPAATGTGVTSSVNPSAVGQEVAITSTTTAGGIPVTEGSVTFKEGSAVLAGPITVDGNGQASFYISSLNAGSHGITAHYDGNTNFAASSGNITQTVNSGTSTFASVQSITYSTSGGKNSDKHLNITVTIVESLINLVSGASVSIGLYRNGSLAATGTGTTGTNGSVTFVYNNAPSGTYTTVVTNVTASGLLWDGVTPDNSYPK